MSEKRFTDYLAHILQAATDACGFVVAWKRTIFFVINGPSRL